MLLFGVKIHLSCISFYPYNYEHIVMACPVLHLKVKLPLRQSSHVLVRVMILFRDHNAYSHIQCILGTCI